MTEPQTVTLSMPAAGLRRLVSAVVAASWTPGAGGDLAVAAAELVAAYCQSRGADPAAIAASLPYSVDLYARVDDAERLAGHE